MERDSGGDGYTVGELADQAGVTSRTIRYYTAEGLLPAPDLRGKYALYNEEHLHRLLLIKHLKEAFFPLHEIRARLEHLSGAEVQELLSQYTAATTSQAPAQSGAAPPQPDSPGGRLRETSSAAEYIAQLLSRRSSSAPLPPPAAVPPPGPAPAPAPKRARRISPAEEKAESWRRIVLAPGLELHVRESAAAQFSSVLNDLMLYAQGLIQPQEDHDDD